MPRRRLALQLASRLLAASLAGCLPAGPRPAELVSSAHEPASGVREAGPRLAVVPPAGPAFRGVRCLDLPGSARRNLQRDADGDLWLELWRRRPTPRADLVRVNLGTGAEEPVLRDILGGHLVGGHLVGLREDAGRRALVVAAAAGAPERPLTPAAHDVAGYLLADDVVFYTTGAGALYRRALDGDGPDALADAGVLGVHALAGDALVVSVHGDAGPELALLALPSPADDPQLRRLGAAPGPLAALSGHVLLDTPSGLDRLLPSAAPTLPDLDLLPGGLLVRPPTAARAGALLEFSGARPRERLAFTGAALAEALAVPEGVWALALHDTDGDGRASPLADEADLCRLEVGAPVPMNIPTRALPRRLAGAYPALRALLSGDLAGGALALDGDALVLRGPGPGPRTHAALLARARDLHRAAVIAVGDPGLELLVLWAANHRHASVSWDSALARPRVRAGGHGLVAGDATLVAAHDLVVDTTPAGLRVRCRGRIDPGGAPLPRPLEVRCAARPRGGGPPVEAAQLLEDMSAGTSLEFALDLGELERPPTRGELRVRHGARDLPLADPDALADLDDYLAVLDAAAALGVSPADARPDLARARARDASHPTPVLAAPDLPALAPDERRRRARAVWDLFSGHAARHHHGRLAALRLAGDAGTIRRGLLE